MYLLTVFLPFSSAILLLGFGRYLGKFGSILFSVVNLSFSFCISLILLYNSLLCQNFYYYILGSWVINTGSLNILWEFQFDILTLVMITMVSCISCFVHLYSWNYMTNDPFLIRFLGLLSLFTFFMLLLLSSANFVQLFLGWEGIGLCSYFLIGFWYTRVQANKSALKALFVNRIGDIAFLLGISCLIYNFYSISFATVFNLIPLFSNNIYYCNLNGIEVVCFWFMVAAVGKSAQLGLHVWLPDAMEGPTPVSALIHAATMVTAGIFLIIKCSFIFEYAPTNLLIITFVGAITALFASTCGLVQNDLKKVIAYSTCSQLGYMFYACGLSNYVGSIFHLINHAFFKALLFLSAGSVIHALSNEQDMRKMGNLKKILPITYISFIIGSLALAGFPFLDGFYSKDFILENSLLNFLPVSLVSFCCLLITSIFTIIYSSRLLYLVFFSPTNSFKWTFNLVEESSFFLLIPLIFLSVGSLFFGYSFKDLFIGAGSSAFNNSIFYSIKNYSIIDTENLINFKNLPFIFIILSVFVVGLYIIYFYFFVFKSYSFYKNFVWLFFINKWYFDYILNKFFKISFSISYLLWIYLDKGLLEITQPILFTTILNKFSLNIYFWQYQSMFFYKYTSMLFFIYFFLICYFQQF